MMTPTAPPRPDAPPPAPSAVARQQGAMAVGPGAIVAVIVCIVALVALKVSWGEHIPDRVFAEAIAQRFTIEPTLAAMLCGREVESIGPVRADSIRTDGSVT